MNRRSRFRLSLRQPPSDSEGISALEGGSRGRTVRYTLKPSVTAYSNNKVLNSSVNTKNPRVKCPQNASQLRREGCGELGPLPEVAQRATAGKGSHARTPCTVARTHARYPIYYPADWPWWHECRTLLAGQHLTHALHTAVSRFTTVGRLSIPRRRRAIPGGRRPTYPRYGVC